MKAVEQVGNYQVLERIGSGGMADVHLARAAGAAGFEKLVVLKRLHEELAQDGEFVAQFIEEARVAASMSHANVVATFDFGQAAGRYFLAMEYVEGMNLRRLQDALEAKGKRLPEPVIVHVLAQVCLGLDYAHTRTDSSGRRLEIVHRDVSPQNVVVAYTGDVKVVDFGIALSAARRFHTSAGVVKGKIRYMPPEQIRDEALDARADQFAAGVMLWEMLFGKRPVPDLPERELHAKMASTPLDLPPSASVDADLLAILQRSVQLDREKRFASCGEMAQALVRYNAAHHPSFSPVDVVKLLESELGDQIRHDRKWIGGLLTSTPSPSPGNAAVNAPTVSTPTHGAALPAGSLRAILTADIHDFSSKMRADETGVMSLLVEFYYASVEKQVRAHGGRLFRKEGDAVWCEFGSVVGAVKAGIAIHGDVAVRNAKKGASPISLRMGIHVGDVTLTADGDVLGNTLSVAKRLETACSIGAILVTDDVHAQIASHALGFQFEERGEVDLKGVGERRVFEGHPTPEWVATLEKGSGLTVDATVVPAKKRAPAALYLGVSVAALAGVALIALGMHGGRDGEPEAVPGGTPQQAVKEEAIPAPATGPLRISVMEFKNQGKDADLEFLSGGLTDVVVADVGGTAGVTLVERVEMELDLAEIDFTQTQYVSDETRAKIGRVVGAEVIVLGGFQRSSGRVRVVARFVRVETGEVLDSVIVEKPANELFALQDELAARLRDSLPALRARLRP